MDHRTVPRKVGVIIDNKPVDFAQCFAAFAGEFHWSYHDIMSLTAKQVEYSYKALKTYSGWVRPKK